MLWIALLALIVFLIVKRKELGFLKSKFYLVLTVLSVAFWIFVIVNQLNTDLVCTPTDEFCNSGNTFWGDVSWGTAIVLVALTFIWTPAILIGYSLKKKSK